MKKEKSVKTKKSNKVMASILNLIKRWAFPVIVCIVVIGVVYGASNYKMTEEENVYQEIKGYDGDGKTIVLENDKLAFTFDPTTTHFEVLVKNSGKVWYSNPVGAANDTAALTADKELLQSTLTITHSEQAGLETLYNRNW